MDLGIDSGLLDDVGAGVDATPAQSVVRSLHVIGYLIVEHDLKSSTFRKLAIFF
jgi:hypothetical protein